MRKFLLLLPFLSLPLHSQQTPEPLLEGNTGIYLQCLPDGEKMLHWAGRADRTYFLQASPDLLDWIWAPNIELGQDGPMSYEVDGPVKAGFFRLIYTDRLPAEGETVDSDDYDGDGLSNNFELTPRPRPGGIQGFAGLKPDIQTNPLRADTDGDGLDDKWELENGLDPTDDGSRDPKNGPNGDPDGDGVTNSGEQNSGTNPKDAGDFPAHTVHAWRFATGHGVTDAEPDKDFICARGTNWLTSPLEFEVSGSGYMMKIADYMREIPFPQSPSQVPSLYGIKNKYFIGPTVSGSTYFSDENGAIGAINSERVWVKSPVKNFPQEFHFLNVLIKGEKNAAPNYMTYKLVTMTIPPGESVSNPVDIEPIPTPTQGKENYAAEYLLPITIENKLGKRLEELKIAKMYPGVVLGTGSQNSPATISIGADDDCFFVKVIGGLGLGQISMKFATVDNESSEYDDDPTEYNLVSGDADTVQTQSMILVSDEVDDNHELAHTNGNPDNSLDDRTHIIQLGGNFKISAVKIGSGQWEETNLKLPVKIKKTVTVQFVNCRGDLLSAHSLIWKNFQIDHSKKYLQERYAQVGVKFNFLQTLEGPICSVINQNDSFYIDSNSEKIHFPNAIKSVIDSGPPNDFENVVMIYLVEQIFSNSGSELSGMASDSSHVDQTEIRSDGHTDQRFKNKIFLAKFSVADFTSSHEMLHVLANCMHGNIIDFSEEYEDNHTIWKTTALGPTQQFRKNNSSVGACKRISQNQEKSIHLNPLCK